MKKLLLSILCMLVSFAFFPFHLQAQYATPGTGVKWNFNDLATHSSGAVTQAGDVFTMHQNITISAHDTLIILSDITVKLASEIQLIINGEGATFLIDAPNQAIFTNLEPETNYGVLDISEGSVIHWNNALFEYGKGISVIDSDFVIKNSTIQNMDYTNNTAGAISGSIGKIIIENCRFLNNQRSAIASSANLKTTFEIRNSYFYNNTLDNSNRPQINLGPCQENDTTKIIGNTVIGVDKTMVGGIGCSSLLGIATAYIVDNNVVKNNRYGITFTGNGISGWIRNNQIIDNNLETNPMNGGSGINITGSMANTHVVVSGNLISGNLWGITLVGSSAAPTCNLGNLTPGNDYNEGKNVFHNNGNGGVLYDFYNNTPNAIMAQNNLWGVDEQTEANIETVIYHQPDNSTLGLVTFMPPYENPVNPPQNFTWSIDNSKIMLQWKRPDALPFETILYNIYKNGLLQATVDALFYVDQTTLSGSASYCISAVYEDEKESSKICEEITLPCNPPQNLNAVLNGSNVELSWDAPEMLEFDSVNYRIFRNDVLLTTVSSTDYIDPDVTSGTYNYCVKAVYQTSCESENVCKSVFMPMNTKELNKNSIVVYPNPATTIIHVQGADIKKILIYNLTGNLIATQLSDTHQVDVSNYKSGIYFLKIERKNGNISSHRVIVLR